MSFLIDTNIISEIRKKARCDQHVAAWYASIDEGELYLSVLVTGAIRRGIELARRRDPAKADALERWLDQVDTAFGDRILPIDRDVAEAWGRMNAERPIPVIDGLLAATAQQHSLTIVSRNVSDFIGAGMVVISPWIAAT